MKPSCTPLSISLFLSLLSFPVSSHSTPTPRVCYDYNIPVNVSSLAYTAGYKLFTSDYDVVGFINALSSGGALRSVPIIGAAPATASYTIGATICSPGNRAKSQKTILLASHGLGYDRRYWDSEFQPEKYSFVDYALSQGYSVFFYDRLGTGTSSKVSGYQEPQANAQLAILQQLTILLRSGKYTGDIDGTPSKIVHLGHSYGSFLSNGLIARTPQLSDGAIITGFAYPQSGGNTFLQSFTLRIAALQAPGKWPGRDNMYLTPADAAANVAVFFYGSSYDKDVMWYTEAVKQPVAVAELISVGSDDIYPLAALNFTKPLLIVGAEFDFAFCGGNCTPVFANNGANAKTKFFPNAMDFKAVIHSGVGHGINFSFNATGAYKVMTDYLKKNGL